MQSYHDTHDTPSVDDEDLCDEELVRKFEDKEREKGVFSEAEIEKESSSMIGQFLERKWQREGNRDVFLASGKVKKMPGCGNVHPADTGIWRG